jgi:hypothetical protein
VDTQLVSVGHKPCTQPGIVFSSGQPAYDLFLERVGYKQTLVTGDGSEDGGFRVPATGQLSSHEDDEDCTGTAGTSTTTVTDHWVIAPKDAATIPRGCYEAPIGSNGLYMPFGDTEGSTFAPNSAHGTVATLAVGTTIDKCESGTAPAAPAPATPKGGAPAKAPGKAKSGCGPSRCAITSAILMCGKPSAADVTGAFTFKAPDNSSVPILWRFSFFRSDGSLLPRFPASGWYGAQGVAAGKTVLETKIYASRAAKRVLATVQDDNDPTQTWSKYANC